MEPTSNVKTINYEDIAPPHDSEIGQWFRVLVLDIDGVPVPNARVAVWDNSKSQEGIKTVEERDLFVNDVTDTDGYVKFYHSCPSHVNFRVRCRHTLHMHGVDMVVPAYRTPAVVTLDFDSRSRHLPSYRSPYV
jgi:protocatechuate 3,4-dioxygenase beta subunit